MIRKRHGHFYGLQWQETQPDIWFAQPQWAGAGAFLDEGIHAVDWMRWIFGEPVSVMAQIDTVGTRFAVDDVGVAIYRFKDRSAMVLNASWLDQAATVTTEVFGSLGALAQSYNDGATTRGIAETSSPLKVYWAKTGGWQVFDLPVHFPRNQEAVIRPFIDCLLNNTPPPVTMQDGRRALELVLAAYQSSKTGQAVSIREVEG
jgi:predicted dehydrogenase